MLFQQNRPKLYHTSEFLKLFLNLFRFIIITKNFKYASCANNNTTTQQEFVIPALN